MDKLTKEPILTEKEMEKAIENCGVGDDPCYNGWVWPCIKVAEAQDKKTKIHSAKLMIKRLRGEISTEKLCEELQINYYEFQEWLNK